MPRIYTSTSDPVDFCAECFPTEGEARALYGEQGDGPDGRGDCFEYDGDHPPYEDEDYHCNTCKARLGRDDNAAPMQIDLVRRRRGRPRPGSRHNSIVDYPEFDDLGESPDY